MAPPPFCCPCSLVVARSARFHAIIYHSFFSYPHKKATEFKPLHKSNYDFQVPRYIITLHELLAHTPHDHVERKSLQHARQQLEDLSRQMHDEVCPHFQYILTNYVYYFFINFLGISTKNMYIMRFMIYSQADILLRKAFLLMQF